MPDEARTPVAIRITRPFGSEDEFLHNELDTITRTTVVLLGAQSRPQGVVLRFEVILSSGDALLRGEGRVVGFKPEAQGHESGLTLRFTRLDARSKALVDRAAAMREARARTSIHPPRPASDPSQKAVSLPRPSATGSPAPARVAPPLPARAAPPPPPSAPVTSPQVLTLDESSPNLPAAPRSEPQASGTLPTSSPRTPRPLPSQPPSTRAELLDRLRQRAKTLSPSAVASLLASRPAAKRA